MNLTLPEGLSLVRFTALTPANCGSSGGSATVDRPVAVDAWKHLPYLSSSAVKGVLAGGMGNVWKNEGSPNEALNTRRTNLFGAPDDESKPPRGEGSKILLGDGELLAFPLGLRNGQLGWVVPVTTLRLFERLGLLVLPSAPGSRASQAVQANFPLSHLPTTRATPRASSFGLDSSAVASLIGVSTHCPLLLAANEPARALWDVAVEERTQTALEEDKRVQAGSLRQIELIPAGTVFLTAVTNAAGRVVDLGPIAPIQLGAWENIGLGYFAASSVATPHQISAAGAIASAQGAVHSTSRPLLMVQAHAAVKDLVEPEDANQRVAAIARSAIYDFGPRLRMRGQPATLGFCLAKARPTEQATPTAERLAYRWLLSQLFRDSVMVSTPSSAEDLEKSVQKCASGQEPLPDQFDEHLLWLRRYAEVLLPTGVED